jgi:DNA mismatch repair protein MutS
LLLLAPAECLLPDTRGELFHAETTKLKKQITQLTGAIITERPAWYFDIYRGSRRLTKHFGTINLEGFGIPDSDPVICPAGAIIEYLNETQKTALKHIAALKKIDRKNYLQLDQATLRSLEVLRTIRTESQKGSLLDSIDQTLTSMGARMYRNWLCMPLADLGAIELRQDAVEELTNSEASLTDIRNLLSNIADLERIAARISTFRAGPKDLIALAATLRHVPSLRQMLQSFTADLLLKLADKSDSIDELAELLTAAIEPEPPSHLRDGGVIRAGFSEQLDSLRSIATDGQTWLKNYQMAQAEKTGIANLRIGYNQVFGYYIEISHSAASRVPPEYVRKQTIKNAERYITEELKQYETKALSARDEALELEVRLFEQIRSQAAQYVPRLQQLAQVIAQCDCLTALGFLARRRNYSRPIVTNGSELIINQGKHPVMAEILGSEFVSNDIELENEKACCIILTGPNMSGKSTYIRQVALLVLMAQTGSFIPAESARIGLTDRIFTRVGASDEIIRGQSTFMVEMTETANILTNATAKSLVILDEVGRGTSTYDGLSRHGAHRNKDKMPNPLCHSLSRTYRAC